MLSSDSFKDIFVIFKNYCHPVVPKQTNDFLVFDKLVWKLPSGPFNSEAKFWENIHEKIIFGFIFQKFGKVYRTFLIPVSFHGRCKYQKIQISPSKTSSHLWSSQQYRHPKLDQSEKGFLSPFSKLTTSKNNCGPLYLKCGQPH